MVKLQEPSHRHEAFCAKQEQVYANFASATGKLGSGALAFSGIIVPQGAFLVAFRHPESITGPVGKLSHDLASVVPSLDYTDQLHTTISDHGLENDREISLDDPDDRKTLDTLAGAVSDALQATDRRTISKRNITFGSPLANAGSIIVPGRGNDALINLFEAVKSTSQNNKFTQVLGGTGLKGPWGAHMTIGRIRTEQVDPAAQRAAIELIHDTPEIGQSAPPSIDVGWLQASPEGFTYQTYERFDLGKYSRK